MLTTVGEWISSTALNSAKKKNSACNKWQSLLKWFYGQFADRRMQNQANTINLILSYLTKDTWPFALVGSLANDCWLSAANKVVKWSERNEKIPHRHTEQKIITNQSKMLFITQTVTQSHVTCCRWSSASFNMCSQFRRGVSIFIMISFWGDNNNGDHIACCFERKQNSRVHIYNYREFCARQCLAFVFSFENDEQQKKPQTRNAFWRRQTASVIYCHCCVTFRCICEHFFASSDWSRMIDFVFSSFLAFFVSAFLNNFPFCLWCTTHRQKHFDLVAKTASWLSYWKFPRCMPTVSSSYGHFLFGRYLMIQIDKHFIRFSLSLSTHALINEECHRNTHKKRFSLIYCQPRSRVLWRRWQEIDLIDKHVVFCS